MLTYIIRRLLYFIPTLFIISLLAFVISLLAPGDPVEQAVHSQTTFGKGDLGGQREIQKQKWRKKLGLDLPVFYLTVHPISHPDTLYRIYPPSKRAIIERLIDHYGNWTTIQAWINNLSDFDAYLAKKIQLLPASDLLEKNRLIEFKSDIAILEGSTQEERFNYQLTKISRALISGSTDSSMLVLFNKLNEANHTMQLQTTCYKNYIPAFHFHANNQYHRWLFGDGNWLTGHGATFTRGIIRGDFGTSYQTGLPVMSELKPRIFWSMLFAFFTILISYIISVPIGVLSAYRKDGWFDYTAGIILFMMTSIPVFWLATILLILFSNPDVWLIFPASGMMPATGYPSHAGILQKMAITAPFMVLPLICYCYGLISYITRTLRITMLTELKQEYIKSALSKGLSPWPILFKHAFRNSLLPLITTMANSFPLVIGGSLIIESIFSIPGMGFEAIYSINHKNYPVIIAIFTLTGLFTLVGYFIADLLYAWVDPRISFKKSLF